MKNISNKKWESNLDKMKDILENVKLVLNYQFLWKISIVHRQLTTNKPSLYIKSSYKYLCDIIIYLWLINFIYPTCVDFSMHG